MKRIVACILVVVATSLGLVGCAEKTEVKKTTKVETPQGTTEKTTTEEVRKTGDNPPGTPSTPTNP